MAQKKKPLGQAALEYLVTYGWALVMIATIIGVLVFAAGGGISTNTCTSFLVFLCKGIGANGDTLVLVLQNSSGQKITINPFFDIRFDNEEGYAIVTYKDQDYRFEDVSIGAGDEFTISAQGMAGAEEISITYTEETTGLTKTVTSSFSTDLEENVEIANDGIDNDGDGKTDCQDADVNAVDCEYTVDADSYPTTITNMFQIIQFSQVRGPDGDPLPDWWEARDSVALTFYVESFVAGTTADVAFSIFSPVTVNLVEGWNVAEITFTTYPISADNIPDFQIKSNGQNFTISVTETPKAFLTLNAA